MGFPFGGMERKEKVSVGEKGEVMSLSFGGVVKNKEIAVGKGGR